MDVRNNINIEEIRESTKRALERLLAVAGLRPGQILVVGCSTSEVLGYKIGSHSSLEIAAPIYEALREAVSANGLYLAVQCCEHLNRALVVERECMEKYNLEEVGVVPHPRAGGSLAVVAYREFQDPVVVESIAAHAGVDIGATFIGMHLRKVAVPVRGEVKYIGRAHVTMARVRPKLIGGERAQYPKGTQVWGDKYEKSGFDR
jgi:uncharacterized protein (TIGR01440 family)